PTSGRRKNFRRRGFGGHFLDTYRSSDADIAAIISDMTETEISQFIRQESRTGRLSRTVKSLNQDVLSDDTVRRRRAEAAIRRLGFI
ncbi:MAG: hypothetical protein AAFW64_03765, partial [Pseudomonadota bacterium]